MPSTSLSTGMVQNRDLALNRTVVLRMKLGIVNVPHLQENRNLLLAQQLPSRNQMASSPVTCEQMRIVEWTIQRYS